MNREEKLRELARITKRLRDNIGQEFLPAADVRRYNHLMGELFEMGEDPELKEAKENDKNQH